MEHTLVSRLKYILECTMGAPNAFEFRREELFEILSQQQRSRHDDVINLATTTATTTPSITEIEENDKSENHHATSNIVISDDDVVKSFVNSVSPNHHQAFVIRFLTLAQIGVRIGDTVKKQHWIICMSIMHQY